MESNQRYLFEEWLRDQCAEIPILTVSATDDRYLSPDASRMWQAWQAAWNNRHGAGDAEALRYEHHLAWRGIERDDCCPICSGAGRRAYPDTSTWRRGRVAGQQVTSDVCDHCWGSGTIIAWPSHKHYMPNKRDAERFRQLRDGRRDPFGPSLVVKQFCGTFGEYEDIGWTEIEKTLDTAIDAARAGERG